MSEPTIDLLAWAQEPLELGFGCFGDGDRNPFVMLVEKSGGQRLVDLESVEGTDAEALLAFGRDMIHEFSDARRYALVFDGYLTPKGKPKQDAVFVEVGVSGEETGWMFAQPYRAKKRGTGLVKIGGPYLVSETPQLLGKRRKKSAAKKKRKAK